MVDIEHHVEVGIGPAERPGNLLPGDVPQQGGIGVTLLAKPHAGLKERELLVVEVDVHDLWPQHPEGLGGYFSASLS